MNYPWDLDLYQAEKQKAYMSTPLAKKQQAENEAYWEEQRAKLAAGQPVKDIHNYDDGIKEAIANHRYHAAKYIEAAAAHSRAVIELCEVDA